MKCEFTVVDNNNWFLMSEISSTGDTMLSALEAVATKGPLSATQCAKLCDINRTVAHRLLTTLAVRLYVVKGPEGYVLGPAAVSLAERAQPSLATIAKPKMDALAAEVGETVVLHGLVDDEAIVLDQSLVQKHLLVVRHNPGSRHPLHKGASGWSLLSFMSQRKVDRYLKQLPSEDHDTVRKRINKVHKAGYAITGDELQTGVHGLAAPIVGKDGHATGAIGILVPAARADRLPDFAKPLLKCTHDIEAALNQARNAASEWEDKKSAES